MNGSLPAILPVGAANGSETPADASLGGSKISGELNGSSLRASSGPDANGSFGAGISDRRDSQSVAPHSSSSGFTAFSQPETLKEMRLASGVRGATSTSRE